MVSIKNTMWLYAFDVAHALHVNMCAEILDLRARGNHPDGHHALGAEALVDPKMHS